MLYTSHHQAEKFGAKFFDMENIGLATVVKHCDVLCINPPANCDLAFDEIPQEAIGGEKQYGSTTMVRKGSS